eukprot:TRINITY_DN46848_c0_g1_i1.p1 TRINITY_DN46848_c0_g1~~TRINITY_DN46848_c0_g1_i1.p1  ORF type:complete len:239 (-),score=56.36 TRINITY_DN46848_c0_g1_i1:4-720(-)
MRLLPTLFADNDDAPELDEGALADAANEAQQNAWPTLSNAVPARRPSLDEVIARLREAEKLEAGHGSDSGTGGRQQLRPSFPGVIRAASPQELGRGVAEMSQALHALNDVTRNELLPERVLEASVEDAPDALTPMSSAVLELMKASGLLRRKLDAIAEASDSLLGRVRAPPSSPVRGPPPALEAAAMQRPTYVACAAPLAPPAALLSPRPRPPRAATGAGCNRSKKKRTPARLLLEFL